MSALPRLVLVALLPVLLAADPLPAGAVARLGSTRLRHADRPNCVVFSPDGKRLVSGGLDGAVSVWDVASGERLATIRKPDTWVSSLRLTHANTRLAVTFGDNRIRFLRPDTLAEIQEVESPTARWLAISPDGTHAAVRADEGNMQVVEVASAVPMLELPASARFPAFSHDSKAIASADEAGTVTVRQIVGGKPLHTVRHGEKLESIAFAPDGKRLITLGTSGSGVVKVWSLGEEQPAAELEARGPVTFLGTDRLAAFRGSAVGVWDFGKKAWVQEVRGVSGAFAFSPDGTKLAATGTGLRVRLWDVPSGKELHAGGDSFPDTALLAPSSDGNSLFIAAGLGGYRWSMTADPADSTATFTSAVTASATGGKRLAVASESGIAVWDDFNPTRSVPAKPSRTVTVAGVRMMAMSADGKRIACTGDDRIVRLIDPVEGRVLRSLPIETGMLALAFTPDGGTLLTHGRDGLVRAWPTGEVASQRWATRVQRGPFGAIAVSPDGKLIAVSSTIRLAVLNASDGKEAFALDREEDDGPVRAVAFSPDGRLLLVGSHGSGGSLKVWEIATRSRVRTYTTGTGGVTRLGVFPDGKRVAAAGADETITVWDLTFRNGKPDPSDEELQAAWAALDSRSAALGVPAIRVLAAGRERGLRAIRAGLFELIAENKRIAEWVRDLDADDFATREAASKALFDHAHRALPAVFRVADKSDSPEVRKRAADIIRKWNSRGIRAPIHGLQGDAVRVFRAVEALERIGGTDAAATLTDLVAFGGRVGDEAKTALTRMKW